MNITLIAAFLLGFAILIIFIGVARSVDTSETDRLEEYLSDRAGVSNSSDARRSGSMLSSRTEMVEGIDKIVRSIALGSRLERELRNADLQLTVTEYLLVWGFCIIVGAGAGYFVSGHPLPAIFTAIFGAIIPYMLLRYRQNKRLHAFDRQLPNVLMQLSGSMRAGYGLLQAIDFVSREMPPPAGKEFAQIVRDVKLGLTTMDALDQLLERVNSSDLQLIVTAVRIQAETGGNLAEILDTVGETIRERVRIKGELRSLTSQQRIAGYVLAGLPIVVFLFLMLINPTFESRLFAPGWTLCIPFGALVSMVVGFIVIRRIVSIEV